MQPAPKHRSLQPTMPQPCAHLVHASLSSLVTHTRLIGQALELARKGYYASYKRCGRKAPRFNVKTVAGALAELTHEENVVGWTLIPRNMLPNEKGEGGRCSFPPVDALDCAGFRGKGQGVLVAHATLDANNAVHPIAMSHMLAAEGDLSVGAHIRAVRHVLGDEVVNQHGNVTFVDGGLALEGQVTAQLPLVHLQRCHTHIQDYLHKKGGSKHEKDIDILNKLKLLPKGKNAARLAKVLYDKLPPQSPLRKIR